MYIYNVNNELLQDSKTVHLNTYQLVFLSLIYSTTVPSSGLGAGDTVLNKTEKKTPQINT